MSLRYNSYSTIIKKHFKVSSISSERYIERVCSYVTITLVENDLIKTRWGYEINAVKMATSDWLAGNFAT
jgi:hypothetical protein